MHVVYDIDGSDPELVLPFPTNNFAVRNGQLYLCNTNNDV
jgi:hypothetical protein